MRLIKIEAIVLKSERSGEKDRSAYLLTRELGLIKAGAKGKKWGSRLEPGVVINGMIYMGKGYTLTEADLFKSYQVLRKDLILWSYASLVLESTYKAILPGDKDSTLYLLLNNTLELLETSQAPLKITLAFFLRLIKLSGYMPDLEACIACEAERGDGYLSHKDGGYLCLSCGQNKGLSLLSKDDFNLIGELKTFQIEDICNYEETLGVRLSHALFRYFEGVFEVKLQSARVLEQLLNNANLKNHPPYSSPLEGEGGWGEASDL